jgi:hypothetical protein
MSSREHSGVRASLPPVDAGDRSATETPRAAVTSDGLGCPEGSRPAGRPAPTPLAAPLLEGGLAFTRRAVLGAAVAVPVASSSRGAERGGGPVRLDCFPRPAAGVAMTEWETTLAALRKAEAEIVEFGRWAASPAWRSFEEREALDDAYGERVSAFDAAMLRLLGTPAPDLEALAMKIGLIGEHRVGELSGGEECLGSGPINRIPLALGT